MLIPIELSSERDNDSPDLIPYLLGDSWAVRVVAASINTAEIINKCFIIN